jgi:hypothetical protein
MATLPAIRRSPQGRLNALQNVGARAWVRVRSGSNSSSTGTIPRASRSTCPAGRGRLSSVTCRSYGLWSTLPLQIAAGKEFHFEYEEEMRQSCASSSALEYLGRRLSTPRR